MGSAAPREFQRRSLPVEDHISWTFVSLVSSGLIEILISLMMTSLISYISRWFWHREDLTEQELKELRMLLHDCPGLVSEMKTMLALVKDEVDHKFAQFHEEEHSMKKDDEVNDKRRAEFQNELERAFDTPSSTQHQDEGTCVVASTSTAKKTNQLQRPIQLQRKNQIQHPKQSQTEPSPQQTKRNPRRPGNFNEGVYR
jgi:hypothetical protein